MEVKNRFLRKTCLEKKRYKRKVRFSWIFRPHTGPGQAHMGPYGPEKTKTICKTFALLGAFKGPVTLP